MMSNPFPRVFLPAALVVLVAGSAVAGPQQTTPVNATAGKPGPTTLHATTRIVYVDVVVRDGHGHVVHGLPESGFSIEEDKHAQHVSLFEEHAPKAEPVSALPAGASPAAGSAEPRLISNVPQTQLDTPLDMVLLDLIDTAPTDQAYARVRMIKFLRAIPPGRRVALFILTNGLHMVQGFTSDSAQLARAAEGIDIRALGRLRTPGEQIQDNDQTAAIDFASYGGSWGVTGNTLLGAAIQDSLLQADQQNMKVRLDVTYRAFAELARAVNGIPGRKNLFWLAGEFPSDIYYTLQNISTSQGTAVGPLSSFGPDTGGPTGHLAASGDALHAFSERVNQVMGDSQIAVYPINLMGIQTDNVGAGNSGIGSALGSQGNTSSTFFNERSDDKVVMNHIADETGGEAFYGNNDPAGMLKRGFEDGENYYTLAYQPTDHNWNGAYRKIDVKLKPGGYHLSYRRGYFALPAQPVGKPLVEFASAMRLETPPSTMLTVSAAPPVETAPGVMRLETRLDLHGVGFVTDDADASDDRKARLQVLLIAYPIGGDPGRAAEINNVLKVGLTSSDYAKVMENGLPLQQTLHLKPGKYAIRLGVLDTVSGRIGTLTLPFTMPGA